MPPSLYVLNFTSNPPLSLVVIFSYAHPPLIFQPRPQVIIAHFLTGRLNAEIDFILAQTTLTCTSPAINKTIVCTHMADLCTSIQHRE